ncbi:MAG: undecaprenyl-diphosphate phosphatase [Pseudomonadota bacterium]
MDLLQIVVLALVQGLTEFLPISSSGHLVLVPAFLGWEDQGLAFDVAVHVGTLLAVVAYFRRDLITMAAAWWRTLSGGSLKGDARLAWAVIAGTIPAGIAGLLFKDLIEQYLRSPQVIGATTIGFGVLLWVADRFGVKRRGEYAIGPVDVLVIGIAQALALIPGTSRSGITITAGLMLGLSREGASRFSFLLAIPLITLAGMVKALDLLEADVATDWTVLGLGTLISAVAAYACIHTFLKVVERLGMLPFALYRVALGVVIFAVFGIGFSTI